MATLPRAAAFSSLEPASTQRMKHSAKAMDSRFFERDYLPTGIEELEFVRSPLYDLAESQNMAAEQVHECLDEFSLKLAMLDETAAFIMEPQKTRESAAFFRYQDEATCSKEEKPVLQFPRGEPLRRSEPGALFRVHKTKDHWQQVARSKSYIAADFLPPRSLLSSDLKESFEATKAWQEPAESTEFAHWKEGLLALIPQLNYDAVVELALYLALEAELNDRQIWRAIEEAALTNLHLYEVKHMCQLEWAVTQLKPKQTSARLDNLLLNEVRQKVEKRAITADEFHYILQGFRNKKSKDLYMKLQAMLGDSKHILVPQKEEGKEKAWAEGLVNVLFSFVANKPRSFGVYQVSQRVEVDELLALYEHDLCEAAQYLDAEGITRMAQAMYLLKTK